MYGTILDMDWLSNFSKRIKIRLKLSAYKTCLIGFIITLAIDFPYYFAFDPAVTTYQLDNNSIYAIWYVGVTHLAKSPDGRIFLFDIYSLRDIFLMILEISYQFTFF
jgi:hypothetical protein